MTEITAEQWEVLRLRRSQQDHQLLITALAVDGTITIAGNSEPPPPDPELEDIPDQELPEPVVTTAQAEAELVALSADLDAQAAEQAKEAEEKAAKDAEKAASKSEAKAA